MKKSKNAVCAGSLVAAAVFAGAPGVNAADVEWRMTSTWPTGINLIESDRHFVEVVNKLGGDRFQINYFPGGALVPGQQVFDATASGTVDASVDWSGYWAGRHPAFALLGAYPMLLTIGDYRVWIHEYGGRELFNEVYGEFGMTYLPINAINMESGVRSSKPLKSLEDLNGLRIRMSGRPQGEILKRLGAVQVQLPGGEVYQALERGVIDAAEFSSPGIDWSLGFQEITEYWMVPGWHQPGSTGGVMVNKESWDALDDWTKTLLETAADATMTWAFGFYERINAEKTKEFLDQGTEVSSLSPEELDRIQQIANEIIVQQSCENALFAKVAHSQLTFLQDYKGWRELTGPFGFGRNPTDLPDIAEIEKCMEG